jgi:hypothetical protein
MYGGWQVNWLRISGTAVFPIRTPIFLFENLPILILPLPTGDVKLITPNHPGRIRQIESNPARTEFRHHRRHSTILQLIPLINYSASHQKWT